jgi:hypothetical protein
MINPSNEYNRRFAALGFKSKPVESILNFAAKAHQAVGDSSMLANANKGLNTIGRRDAIRTDIMAIAKAAKINGAVLEMARQAYARRASAISDKAFPKRDMSDIASVLWDVKMWERLESMNTADALRAVQQPAYLRVAIESPIPPSTIPRAELDRALATHLEKTRAADVAELKAEAEALRIAGAALESVTGTMRDAMDLQPHQFDKWFRDEAPSPTDKEREAAGVEMSNDDVERLAHAGKALDFEARHRLIEALLAGQDDDLAKQEAALKTA